jgi:NmrA-like family
LPTAKHHKAVSDLKIDGATFVQVDYTDKGGLAKHLHGVQAVLSFFLDTSDPTQKTQKNLIDASIEAGVKRFAPNEWATYALNFPVQ